MFKLVGNTLSVALFLGLSSTAAFASILAPPEYDTEHFPLAIDFTLEPAPVLQSSPITAQEESQWQATRSKILSDFGNRISAEFLIPAGLRERTAFWFEVYTRYGEAHHIVHHGLHPSIVFQVVDTTETLLNGQGPLWLRRKRGADIAKKKASEIRHTLHQLARRKSYENLTPLEKTLFDKLANLPGSRRTVFSTAALRLRTQLGQKDFYERGLNNSSRYLPIMEEEFRSAGLPTELTRLPFVESSFNEDARSKVGASGIWQIMPATGRSYLIVNDHIDERNSPLKATRAAAQVLRTYYRAMGTWPLAITSYNNGIGNIKKAIRAAGSRDLSVIVERYHRGDFRFASSNFFSCFLAALYAEKYNELIFKRVPREPLIEHEVVRLNSSTRAMDLAKSVGISREDLLRYNLDLRNALRNNATLPRGLRIYLPPGLKAKLSRPLFMKDQKA